MKDLLLKVPSVLRPFAKAVIDKIEELEEKIKELENKLKDKSNSKKK